MSCLVTASKLTPLSEGIVVSVAIGLYSMSFLLTDFLGEIYGKKQALRAVYMAIFGAIIYVFAAQFSVATEPAAYYGFQSAYATVLGTAPRLVIASIAAFIVAQLCDVLVFDKLKEVTNGRFLFLRNNLSTLVGQTLDTIIFYLIAFWGIVPNILELIVVTILVKVAIAIADTPFLYAAKNIVSRRSGKHPA